MAEAKLRARGGGHLRAAMSPPSPMGTPLQPADTPAGTAQAAKMLDRWSSFLGDDEEEEEEEGPAVLPPPAVSPPRNRSVQPAHAPTPLPNGPPPPAGPPPQAVVAAAAARAAANAPAALGPVPGVAALRDAGKTRRPISTIDGLREPRAAAPAPGDAITRRCANGRADCGHACDGGAAAAPSDGGCMSSSGLGRFDARSLAGALSPGFELPSYGAGDAWPEPQEEDELSCVESLSVFGEQSFRAQEPARTVLPRPMYQDRVCIYVDDVLRW